MWLFSSFRNIRECICLYFNPRKFYVKNLSDIWWKSPQNMKDYRRLCKFGVWLQYTFKAVMWTQPVNGMNSHERRLYFGYKEPSKTPAYPVSQYDTFQTRRQHHQQQQQQQPIIIRGFIFDYCENTSLHGMKYIAQRDRHWYERWVFKSRNERFVCPEFQINKCTYSRQDVFYTVKSQILIYKNYSLGRYRVFCI